MSYIHRTVVSDTEPEKISRDNRGTEIAPGLRVAFNRSGDVEIGKIIGITKNEWEVNKRLSDHWYLHFEIKIECEDGHISKIKNPNSFVII